MDAEALYEMIRARIEAALAEAGSNPIRAATSIKTRHPRASRTLVRDIIKGKTKNPTVETLRLIAEELGQPVSYFLGGEGAQREMPLPNETQLAEVLAGLLPFYMAGGQIDADKMLKLAAVLRETLAQYAENPAGFDESANLKTLAVGWSNLSLRRSA